MDYYYSSKLTLTSGYLCFCHFLERKVMFYFSEEIVRVERKQTAGALIHLLGI